MLFLLLGLLIPLAAWAQHLKGTKNGEYTLSFNLENMDLDYLHLIDNLTGADVDLLQTHNYAFAANSFCDFSRFYTRVLIKTVPLRPKKAYGMPIDMIAKYTQLSRDQIQKP